MFILPSRYLSCSLLLCLSRFYPSPSLSPSLAFADIPLPLPLALSLSRSLFRPLALSVFRQPEEARARTQEAPSR